MTLFLNTVIAGIAIGSVYGLIAIGYNVVYSGTQVFNLAQGDLVMASVLSSYYVLHFLHWAQWGAFLAALVVATSLSLVEERFIIRQFLKRPGHNLGWFISTLAYSVIIETVCSQLYGDNPPNPVPSPFPTRALHIGPLYLSPQFAFVLVGLVLVTFAIDQFYRRTWLGVAMRASAENREAASLRGVAAKNVSMISFGISGLVAGVAGFVAAPVLSADPTIGLTYGLSGFVVLAVGGFGSLRGALIGGFALGIAEQLFSLYVTSRFVILADLGLLLLVLAVRPTGLFSTGLLRRV
jgi:branched-chain amino acid transport system permease protein